MSSGSWSIRLPVAREGWPFIAVPGLAGLGLIAAGFPWAGGLLLLLAAACAGFFRDPERAVPDDPSAIVSPADGRVVDVVEGPSEHRVAIFLSILDVHVNRAPVAGRVGEVAHRPGRFLAAFDRRASEINEQTRLTVESERGPVGVRQIAGLIARRIVCRVQEGDRLAAGERFGLIRFGSRVEVHLPSSARVVVRVGDRVAGGSSIIGRWTGGAAPRADEGGA